MGQNSLALPGFRGLRRPQMRDNPAQSLTLAPCQEETGIHYVLGDMGLGTQWGMQWVTEESSLHSSAS